MSTAEQPNLVSLEDYLSAEETSESKSEYVNGWLRAMSGGSLAHSQIKTGVLGYLWQSLRGQACSPLDSDTKLRIRSGLSTKFYYSDAMVVCEDRLLNVNYQDHPVLVVEVLSKSTRTIDLDEKMSAYLGIDSLEVYLIFEQDKPMAICMRRTEGGFLREVHEGMSAVIALPFLRVSLPFSEVYSRVEFPPPGVREPEAEYVP
jgi:Uma2 family endonuclease